MFCPICNKRKAERFCPAKDEKICAVCCGTEREVTIDCPVDCSYLIAAHRYELKQNKPLSVSEVPFPDLEIPRDLIHLNRSLVSGLAFAILKCASENPSANDVDVLVALQALAENSALLVQEFIMKKRQPVDLHGLFTQCWTNSSKISNSS